MTNSGLSVLRSSGEMQIPNDTGAAIHASDLLPVIAYLQQSHGFEIENIVRKENDFAELVVTMNGPLPMDELERRFNDQLELRFLDHGLFSAVSYDTLLGRDTPGSNSA